MVLGMEPSVSYTPGRCSIPGLRSDWTACPRSNSLLSENILILSSFTIPRLEVEAYADTDSFKSGCLNPLLMKLFEKRNPASHGLVVASAFLSSLETDFTESHEGGGGMAEVECWQAAWGEAPPGSPGPASSSLYTSPGKKTQALPTPWWRFFFPSCHQIQE